MSRAAERAAAARRPPPAARSATPRLSSRAPPPSLSFFVNPKVEHSTCEFVLEDKPSFDIIKDGRTMTAFFMSARTVRGSALANAVYAEKHGGEHVQKKQRRSNARVKKAQAKDAAEVAAVLEDIVKQTEAEAGEQ